MTSRSLRDPSACGASGATFNRVAGLAGGVPLENYQLYSRPSDEVSLKGKHRATSFPTEMDKILKGSVSELVRASARDLSTVRWFIPHGYSWNVWLGVFGASG